jgi:hypothetical protein
MQKQMNEYDKQKRNAKSKRKDVKSTKKDRMWK